MEPEHCDGSTLLRSFRFRADLERSWTVESAALRPPKSGGRQTPSRSDTPIAGASSGSIRQRRTICAEAWRSGPSGPAEWQRGRPGG